MKHRLPTAIFLISLAAFLILMIRYQRKPVIHNIDHILASSGENIELKGRYFGDETEGARLIAGTQTLSSANIIEWRDNRIIARAPRVSGTVLIKVKNRSGISNGIVLGSAARFPEVEYGPWLPGVPFIDFIDPGEVSAGTLMTLLGKGFGIRQRNSRVWVNHSDEAKILGSETPDLEKYIHATSYSLWIDSMIRFWMPPNAISGNIYIQRGTYFSNPIHLDVAQGPGQIEIGPQVLWSLRQELSISGIGAFPGNFLYLRIPIPVSNSLNQKTAITFEGKKEDHTAKLYRDGSIDIMRLDEMTSGEKRDVSRQIVLGTASVKVQINPDLLTPYDPTHPELEVSLEADGWIRPDMVTKIASRVVGNLRDDWRKSRAIYNYVRELLEWNDAPQSREISDYLVTKQADSEGYSFLFCSLARSARIPARPIGGIFIDSTEQRSRAWWWAEIWIEKFGWIPVDPACGDLAPHPSWVADADNAEDYYFGGLDERHIAFSRGVMETSVLQTGSELRNPLQIYSLQSIWEEISGNLHVYTSDWKIPWVTAVYR